MLCNTIIYLSTAAALSLLLLAIVRTRGIKRCLSVLGCVILLLGIYALDHYPIESLIYAFPTPEAVAEFVCPDGSFTIVEGQESALIIYPNSNNETCTMISPKTKAGYRVGGSGSDAVTQSIKADSCFAQIRESRRCSDRYIFIFGIMDGSEITVTDTIGSQYTVISQPFSKAYSNTSVWACAFIKEFEGESFSATLNDGLSTSTATIQKTW